jgi:hypothetical protein
MSPNSPEFPLQQKIADDTEVPVRVVYGELELGKLARSAGGRWDADVKLWYIPYGKIKGTELEKHIILNSEMKQKTSNIECQHLILDADTISVKPT